MNNLVGLTFDPLLLGEQIGGGGHCQNDVWGSTPSFQVVGFKRYIHPLIVYRVLFLVVRKIRERVLPMFQTIYTKKSLKHLKESPLSGRWLFLLRDIKHNIHCPTKVLAPQFPRRSSNVT